MTEAVAAPTAGAPTPAPFNNGALSTPAPTKAVADPNPGDDDGQVDPLTGKPKVVAAPAAAKPATEVPALSLTEPDAEVLEATPPGTVVEYSKTGNAALDMSLAFLGKHGYGPDHPAMQAAKTGDFAMLKADLATKGIAGSAEHIALGEQAYGVELAKNNAKAEAGRKAIYDTVGGEAKWGEISAWAKANAEPAEAKEVNAALAKGGLVAKATAKYLAELHAKASGTVVEPANVVGGNAASSAGAAAGINGPLSPRAYVAAVNDLKGKMGGNPVDGSKEYAALQARRRAWKG